MGLVRDSRRIGAIIRSYCRRIGTAAVSFVNCRRTGTIIWLVDRRRIGATAVRFR